MDNKRFCKQIILEKPNIGKIVLPGLDMKKATEEITDGIFKYLITTEGNGVVIGLSGGVDSTLTGMLCKKGLDQFEAETGNTGRFYALLMPSKENNNDDTTDGEKVAVMLGLAKRTKYDLIESVQGYAIVPIDRIADTALKTLPCAFRFDEYGKSVPHENLLSRQRMALLYAVKEAVPGLRVVGTGNWDEDYGLGYCTKYGDSGVDFSPIAELPKRIVRQMAAYNGASADLAERIATAGLRQGQTDREDLGYDYFQSEIIVTAKDNGLRDKITEITGYTAQHNPELDNLERQLVAEINEEMVREVLYRHEKLAPHKLSVPPVMKVSSLIYERGN